VTYNLTTYHKKIITPLTELYEECFGSGLSAQHIDKKELQLYLSHLLKDGKTAIAEENNQLAGAILGISLKEDKDLPEKIRSTFKPENCFYIAELMVKSNFRGLGIGKKLIELLFAELDKERYPNVFIRVWDQNKTAIHLYKQVGFVEIADIKQQKLKSNNLEIFEMRKIYLHKNIERR